LFQIVAKIAYFSAFQSSFIKVSPLNERDILKLSRQKQPIAPENRTRNQNYTIQGCLGTDKTAKVSNLKIYKTSYNVA
jgi:hypothetical protein